MREQPNKVIIATVFVSSPCSSTCPTKPSILSLSPAPVPLPGLPSRPFCLCLQSLFLYLPYQAVHSVFVSSPCSCTCPTKPSILSLSPAPVPLPALPGRPFCLCLQPLFLYLPYQAIHSVFVSSPCSCTCPTKPSILSLSPAPVPLPALPNRPFCLCLQPLFLYLPYQAVHSVFVSSPCPSTCPTKPSILSLSPAPVPLPALPGRPFCLCLQPLFLYLPYQAVHSVFVFSPCSSTCPTRPSILSLSSAPVPVPALPSRPFCLCLQPLFLYLPYQAVHSVFVFSPCSSTCPTKPSILSLSPAPVPLPALPRRPFCLCLQPLFLYLPYQAVHSVFVSSPCSSTCPTKLSILSLSSAPVPLPALPSRPFCLCIQPLFLYLPYQAVHSVFVSSPCSSTCPTRPSILSLSSAPVPLPALPSHPFCLCIQPLFLYLPYQAVHSVFVSSPCSSTCPTKLSILSLSSAPVPLPALPGCPFCLCLQPLFLYMPYKAVHSVFVSSLCSSTCPTRPSILSLSSAPVPLPALPGRPFCLCLQPLFLYLPYQAVHSVFVFSPCSSTCPTRPSILSLSSAPVPVPALPSRPFCLCLQPLFLYLPYQAVHSVFVFSPCSSTCPTRPSILSLSAAPVPLPALPGRPFCLCLQPLFLYLPYQAVHSVFVFSPCSSTCPTKPSILSLYPAPVPVPALPSRPFCLCLQPLFLYLPYQAVHSVFVFSPCSSTCPTRLSILSLSPAPVPLHALQSRPFCLCLQPLFLYLPYQAVHSVFVFSPCSSTCPTRPSILSLSSAPVPLPALPGRPFCLCLQPLFFYLPYQAVHSVFVFSPCACTCPTKPSILSLSPAPVPLPALPGRPFCLCLQPLFLYLPYQAVHSVFVCSPCSSTCPTRPSILSLSAAPVPLPALPSRPFCLCLQPLFLYLPYQAVHSVFVSSPCSSTCPTKPSILSLSPAPVPLPALPGRPFCLCLQPLFLYLPYQAIHSVFVSSPSSSTCPTRPSILSLSPAPVPLPALPSHPFCLCLQPLFLYLPYQAVHSVFVSSPCSSTCPTKPSILSLSPAPVPLPALPSRPFCLCLQPLFLYLPYQAVNSVFVSSPCSSTCPTRPSILSLSSAPVPLPALPGRPFCLCLRPLFLYLPYQAVHSVFVFSPCSSTCPTKPSILSLSSAPVPLPALPSRPFCLCLQPLFLYLPYQAVHSVFVFSPCSSTCPTRLSILSLSSAPVPLPALPSRPFCVCLQPLFLYLPYQAVHSVFVFSPCSSTCPTKPSILSLSPAPVPLPALPSRPFCLCLQPLFLYLPYQAVHSVFVFSPCSSTCPTRPSILSVSSAPVPLPALPSRPFCLCLQPLFLYLPYQAVHSVFVFSPCSSTCPTKPSILSLSSAPVPLPALPGRPFCVCLQPLFLYLPYQAVHSVFVFSPCSSTCPTRLSILSLSSAPVPVPALPGCPFCLCLQPLFLYLPYQAVHSVFVFSPCSSTCPTRPSILSLSSAPVPLPALPSRPFSTASSTTLPRPVQTHQGSRPQDLRRFVGSNVCILVQFLLSQPKFTKKSTHFMHPEIEQFYRKRLPSIYTNPRFGT